jgi:hypothetical protein
MSHAIGLPALLLGLVLALPAAAAGPANLQGTWVAKDGPVAIVLTLATQRPPWR